MKRISRCSTIHLFAWLVIFGTAVAAFSPPENYDERRMQLLDETTNLTVPVYVAAFGIRPVYPTRFNLMLPPAGDNDDGHLCALPEIVSNGNREEWGFSIALYVKDGGHCSADKKARVALQIRKTVPAVKFLLIYETDTAHATAPATLFADNDSAPEAFDKIGVLYVRYEQAKSITAQMEARQAMSLTSPNLMDPGSINWSLQFRVEGTHSDDDFRGDNYRNRSSHPDIGLPPANSSEDFYWFRFVLFALLIIAPCFRVLYLWYVCGGRLLWRRNEQTGRIVGIQYIPPIPFWLAIGHGLPQPLASGRLGRVTTLTEAQFANLPEIKYRPAAVAAAAAPGVANDGDDEEPLNKDEADNHEDESKIATEEPDLVVESTPEEPEIRLHPLLEEDLEKQLSADVSVDSDLEKKEPAVDDDAESDSTVQDLNLVPLEDPTLAALGEKNDVVVALQLPSSSSSSAPIEVPQESATERDTATTTTCTACSICIDDFETGETLILLPRCKHAFHRDCIHPWLLERQGCCPLCKTSVLPDEQETDESCADEPPQQQDDATSNENASAQQQEQR